MAAIPLDVFVTEASAAMAQSDAPDDISGCNKPAARRDIILGALRSDSGPQRVNVVEVPAPKEHLLPLARLVHSDGFVYFLETAWARWASLEHQRDSAFFSPAAPGSDIPSLVPGNAPNRDWAQRPGSSVASQSCMYQSDREVPIYGALLPALAADQAVASAALVVAEGAATAAADAAALALAAGGKVHPKRCPWAGYALVTHPGHHASRESAQGYCYVNSAAILAHRLAHPGKGLVRRVAVQSAL